MGLHNLPLPVGIGLTELPNSGGAKALSAPPLTTALISEYFFEYELKLLLKLEGGIYKLYTLWVCYKRIGVFKANFSKSGYK